MNENIDIKQAIHEALATFPLKIWNSAPDVIDMTLPEAFTSISKDVKTLKSNVNELKTNVDIQAELLQGVKRRKEMKSYLKNLWTLVTKFTSVRIVMWLLVRGTAIYGFIELIIKLFWN